MSQHIADFSMPSPSADTSGDCEVCGERERGVDREDKRGENTEQSGERRRVKLRWEVNLRQPRAHIL